MKSGRHPKSGQALVLVIAAAGIFMLGGLGLAIDGAQMYAHRQMAQAAADAAAQSAIMSILRGIELHVHPSVLNGQFFYLLSAPAALDLRTPCVYAQLNGFGTAADTVTVSFPGTISGVTLSLVSTPAVTVTVSRVINTDLIRFVGPSTATIRARASAGILSSVPPTAFTCWIHPRHQPSPRITGLR